MLIKLLQLTNDEHPNGNVKGKEVYNLLLKKVESRPDIDSFGISLEGIVATDASFPRESVMALAKHYNGEKFFYLKNLSDEDLIDNWTYGAIAKEQPMTVWDGSTPFFIGPDMSKSIQELADYFLQRKSATTSEVSDKFDITAQNASTRLKKLFSLGYLKRTEEIAESGGREYVYKLIGEF